MSEIFMVVDRESKLYQDYFEWLVEHKTLINRANQVFERFGIESKRFMPNKERLSIEPTKSDREKFAGMMMADRCSFKKNSAPNKAWVEAMKDIKHMKKPQLFYYASAELLGFRWQEQLFHIGEVLYCHIDSTGEVKPPRFGMVIKGSEYYAALESETLNETSE